MIKNPGSDIAFWTILFMLSGVFVSYTSFAEGKTFLGLVFGALPMSCVLIWLDIRPAKWIVSGYFLVAMIGSIFVLSSKGFSWNILFRGCLAGYIACLFAKWNGGPNSVSETSNPYSD